MSQPQIEHSEIRHGTAVSIDGRATLIEGPSGSGKSALALQLLALGAGLIADDATRLRARDNGVWAEAPDTLPAAIEARGIGLLRAPLVAPAPVVLIIDLEFTQTERLPAPAHRILLGQRVALLHKIEGVHFPAAILQYVREGGVLET